MRTSRKLIASLLTFVASILLLRVNGWFGLGFVVALPLSILYWFDYGHELRQTSSTSRTRRFLGIVMGVPQALFGLVCLLAGVAIICWVVYNSLWKPLPEYSGGFLTFGMGPFLALFGIGLVVDAFRRGPSEKGDQG